MPGVGKVICTPCRLKYWGLDSALDSAVRDSTPVVLPLNSMETSSEVMPLRVVENFMIPQLATPNLAGPEDTVPVTASLRGLGSGCVDAALALAEGSTVSDLGSVPSITVPFRVVE